MRTVNPLAVYEKIDGACKIAGRDRGDALALICGVLVTFARVEINALLCLTTFAKQARLFTSWVTLCEAVTETFEPLPGQRVERKHLDCGLHRWRWEDVRLGLDVVRRRYRRHR